MKHTYPRFDKIQLNARSGRDFSNFQTELSDHVYFPHGFIFHVAPDIMIRKTKHLVTTTAGTLDSSSEDESAIEACFQRAILQSKSKLLPEKLGELITLSYVCWCAR